MLSIVIDYDYVAKYVHKILIVFITVGERVEDGTKGRAGWPEWTL